MGVSLALSTMTLALVLGASEPELGVPELVSPAAEAVALTWEAPAGCPDAAVVRRALSGYLGEGPSVEAGAAVRAVGRVTRSGGLQILRRIRRNHLTCAIMLFRIRPDHPPTCPNIRLSLAYASSR